MKKTSIIILNKKQFLIIIIFIIGIVFFTLIQPVIKTVSPKTKYTVVIDAGHGGIDGGSVGKTTNITEASLNLNYAKCLQEYLLDFGFNTIMTRLDENGLYSPFASNKKKDDMKKRKSIIENSNADFVISIHMNSYLPSAKGTQVYYGKDDEPSKNLASNITKHFVKNIENARKEIKVGDYYMLNAIKVPSVLVECGFLSNPQEESLLISEEYKHEICYCILLGILEYLQ